MNSKRGCYWFDKAFGRRLEFGGGYHLRKIMNEDRTTHKALNMVVPAPPGMQPCGFLNSTLSHID